jgi:hypothetical protein
MAATIPTASAVPAVATMPAAAVPASAMEPTGGCAVEASAATTMETAASASMKTAAAAAMTSALGKGGLRSETECQEQNSGNETFESDGVFHRNTPYELRCAEHITTCSIEPVLDGFDAVGRERPAEHKQSSGRSILQRIGITG